MISSASARRRPVWVQIICALTIVALAVSALGCFGQFPLTRIVYEFNRDITDNALGQTLIMWVFIIIPVYSFAMLGDAIVFNLIEFWTGETALEASTVQTDIAHQTALTISDDGSVATLTTTRDGEVIAEIRSVEVAPGLFEMRSADGKVLGIVVHTSGGDLELRDARGGLVDTITAAQIAQYRTAHAL